MDRKIQYTYKNLQNETALILEAKVSEDWRCNIWHVRGSERDLIIDTGLGLWPITKDIFQISERPIIALCTHSHHDHAGGLSQFETRAGHPAEKNIFANPTRQSTVANLIKPEHLIEKPYESFEIEKWCMNPAPITNLVQEGDVIDLEALRSAGLVGKNTERIRVFLSGKILKSITTKGLVLTAGARRAVEEAGGKVED